MQNAPFRITIIRSKWGESIAFPSTGIVCIVGANNVGKSQFLREIANGFDHPANGPEKLLISEIDYEMNLLPENCDEWFQQNVPWSRTLDGRLWYHSSDGASTNRLEDIRSTLFGNPGGYLGHLTSYFLHSLTFESRSHVLSETSGSGNMQVAGNPLNRMFRSPELEKRLSAISQANFGFPLILDRFNGNVQLRVSNASLDGYEGNWYTEDYSNAVLAQPALGVQGDGVKNYLGIALYMLTSNVAVTLLDEPEAFLHPAQSRGLGRFLGQTVVERQNQLVVATHDRDFVIGLLDSGAPLTVVRLSRDENTTSFTTIATEKIGTIWSNPFLRYSNLLQGLFHKVVVLCEADADCMWYSAVASHVGKEIGVDTNEILFVPGGGKSQLPKSLAALKSLGVKAFTITDFDSLLDGETIPAILNSKGLGLEDIRTKLSGLSKSVATNGSLAAAKLNGVEGLGQGGEASMGRELVDALRDHDVIIVPTGEMESFDRTIGGKSSVWVSAALTKNLHNRSAVASACIRPAVESLLI